MTQTSETMPADFVRIDLHVHTPASSCYRGPDTQHEYLRILHQAHSRQLSIIAITDHNSIEGYRTFQTIKETLENEKRSLSSITDSAQATRRLQLIETDLHLFQAVHILPGVEFEVSNGIHLLVIFSEATPLDQITRFLNDGGYHPDNYGRPDPTVLSRWDIFRLYEESARYDCLVIDAHTDSSKGIYNTIRASNTRAACYSSSHLSAICYKNEEQKEKLRSILREKHYQRSTPLSFLRFSDAHAPEEVGRFFSWVRLQKISFSALKPAFANPSEMVSTEEPSMSRTLDALLDLPNSFPIPHLSPASYTQIKKHICALGNADGGYILLGITPNKVKTGLTTTGPTAKDRYLPLLDQVSDCIQAIEPNPRSSVTGYPLLDDKLIISIHVQKSPVLLALDDDSCVYSMRDRRIRALKAPEIDSLVQERVLTDVESRISSRLASVHKDCDLIQSILSSLPIVRSVDDTTVPARLRPLLAQSIALDPDSIHKLNKINANGTRRGNVLYAPEQQPPRLPDTYLRYSLPLFTLRNLGLSSLKKETIYVIPGGAVHYSRRDYPFFSERLPQILKIHGPLTPSTRFVAAFLKSSFNLWYLHNKHDDINIFDPKVFNQLRLPKVDLDRPDVRDIITDIDTRFDTILKLEDQILGKVVGFKDDDTDTIRGCLEEHNKLVDEIAHGIDTQIYKLLNLSDHEIATIEDNLRLNGIYLPGAPSHLSSANTAANELQTTLTGHDSPSGTNQS